MVTPITAVVSAGPEDVLYPRFWAGQTVNARGRVLLDNGDAVQGAGVSFLFRWVADRSVQIELAGIWDVAAQMWRCPVILDRIGTWEARLVCLSPQRQSDWMVLEMVATPGEGAAPGGSLWISQQGQVLTTMSGAGLTGVRIAELLEATDPAGVTMAGVAADGSDVGVPWTVVADGVKAAAADAVGEIDDITNRLASLYTLSGDLLADAEGDILTGEARDPYAGGGQPGRDGVDGSNGLNGRDGWAPRLAVAADGDRRVIQVVGWVGGTGSAPPTGYVTAAGALSQSIADGVDVRGPAGSGGGGGTGLSPIPAQRLLANVADAAALPAGIGLGRGLSFRAGALSAPLPFRLPRIKLMAFGDSITARSGSTSYATWTAIRSRMRYGYQPLASNKGVSGNTVADLLLRWDTDIVPFMPDVLWLAVGTNDAMGSVYGINGRPAAAYTFDQTQARYLDLIGRCQRLGIQLWIVPVRPRGPGDLASDTANQAAIQAMAMRINNWLHGVASTTPGVMLMDSRSQWVDPATGYPRDQFVYPLAGDQVHPSPKGAFEESDVYVEAMATLTHAGHEPHLIRNPLDVASAANPGGNLLANGLMMGSAGTLGSGVTGQVATGWRVSTGRPAGIAGTVTCALEDRGSRGQWQIVTVADRLNPAGTDDASYQEVVSLEQTVAASALWQAGDALQVLCDVDVGASALVAGVSAEVRYFAGGSGDILNVCPAISNRYEEGPTRPWSGILMPDPLVVTAPGAGSTSLRVRLNITLITRAPGARVTAKIGQMTLRTARL